VAGDNAGGPNWYLVRYNANGTLDPTFGTGGKVTSNFSAPQVRAMVQQPDGKLVVLGGGTTVARYNANGSLDTTFGNGGVTTTVGPGGGLSAAALALYPGTGSANAGTIALTGNVHYASNNTFQPLVERFNPDGSLDTTFGNGTGYVTIGSALPSNQANETLAGSVQSDGKLVAAGWGTFGATMLLARLNPDGSPDTIFGNGGLVTTAIASGSPSGSPGNVFYGVAIQPNGDIVAAGKAYNGSKYNFAVARYLPSEPEVGTFTANPNPVASGTSTTLAASNITDGNPNSTITQVTF